MQKWIKIFFSETKIKIFYILILIKYLTALLIFHRISLQYVSSTYTAVTDLKMNILGMSVLLYCHGT